MQSYIKKQMKGLKSILLFLSLLLSTTWFSYGQSIIEIKGTVSDAETKELLTSATVVFSPLDASSIVGYAITDKEGAYQTKFNSKKDSLKMKISFLGYKTFEKKIAAKSQYLDISLESTSESLDEVFLRRPPITQRGDTLVFDPEAFKSDKDRSIQDVLAKMPGVDISPEGEIQYQGKPINKFYVEGLDLMGGQYGMISKNLSPDKVSSVEILENHQPIRVLDSIEPSENAALNIRLKNNVSMTGNATVGGGATPGLWTANIVPMFFIKNLQVLTSYQTNNTGEDLNSGFRRFSVRSFRFGQSSNQRKDWLSTAGVGAPSFASKRWLDNTSHAGSVNLLFKDKTKTEYSLKTSYHNDFRERQGGVRTTYTLPEGDFVIDDKTEQHVQSEKFEASLSIERNEKSNFFRNQLDFSKQWDGAFSRIVQNQEPQAHRLHNPFINISNNLERIFTLGAQLVTFNSNIGYNESPQELSLTPGVFENIFSNDQPIDKLEQKVFHKRLFANHSLTLTKALGKINFDIRPGFNYSTQTMNSHIILDDNPFANVDYQNDMRWRNMAAFVHVNSNYRTDNLDVSLRLPFEWNSYEIEDRWNDTKKTNSPFTLNPSLWARYKFASYWQTNLNGSYSKNYGPTDNLYYGYLLSNFRSLNRRDVPISSSTSYNGRWGLEYRNPLTTWFARIGYSYRQNQNSQITSTQTLPDGSTVLDFIERDNTSDSHNLSGSISKLVSEINTTFTYNASYAISESDMFLNEVFYKNKGKTLSNSLKLSSDITDWLTAEFIGSLSQRSSKNALRANTKVTTQNHELGIYVYPADGHTVSLSAEWMQNKLGIDKEEDFFGDFMYRFTFSEKKIDVEFSVINIFNKNMYRNLSVGDYTFSESYFILRPRQFLISLRVPL